MKLLLVVDDYADNRVVFSAILSRHRYGVSLATNGLEALDEARRHKPDLILMDLQMPGLNGWEAARLLKIDPDTASIPIIAVTAEDHPLPRLKEAGFCSCVRKPIVLVNLVEAVRLCLEGLSPSNLWVDQPSSAPTVLLQPEEGRGLPAWRSSA